MSSVCLSVCVEILHSKCMRREKMKEKFLHVDIILFAANEFTSMHRQQNFSPT